MIHFTQLDYRSTSNESICRWRRSIWSPSRHGCQRTVAPSSASQVAVLQFAIPPFQVGGPGLVARRDHGRQGLPLCRWFGVALLHVLVVHRHLSLGPWVGGGPSAAIAIATRHPACISRPSPAELRPTGGGTATHPPTSAADPGRRMELNTTQPVPGYRIRPIIRYSHFVD